jgi:hypothetical protein
MMPAFQSARRPRAKKFAAIALGGRRRNIHIRKSSPFNNAFHIAARKKVGC